MDIENDRTWKECFEVSGVHLPTGYYFGLSATTGDLTDFHDVISVKTYELISDKTEEDRTLIVPRAEFYEAPRDRHNDENGLSGLAIFFIVLGVMIAIVVIGVVVVICVDSAGSRPSGPGRKRFY